MDDFHGRTVLVTGGDGGVGTAVAAQFASRGATVILAGIRPARGAEAAARLGPSAAFLELDVSREAHWERAIVNVSSAVAVRMHWQSPAYGVSKSAILATTRVAAQHCNHHRYGIRVNAVLPGPVDTEMMRSNVSDEAAFEQMAKFLRDKYGLARIGVPDDIANIVTFLASSQAAYVTGAAFTIDGGQSA